MKITSHVNAAEQPKPDAGKALNRAQRADQSSAAESEATSGALQGRDFASVLEEVSRESDRQHEQPGRDDERTESKSSDRAEHERLVQKREDRRDGEAGGSGFGARSGVSELSIQSEATGARAILHIADLEKIVAAVRTQMLGGGRNQVTIDLQRSVLEGLRIRLTRDADGRLTAELIAATERVRAQVDARSGELAELLRSRGLNLATLTTTVEAGAGEGRHAQEDGSGGALERLSGPTGAKTAAASEGEPVETVEQATDESSSTYRA